MIQPGTPAIAATGVIGRPLGQIERVVRDQDYLFVLPQQVGDWTPLEPPTFEELGEGMTETI
eukprot:5541564-Prorocentrum_lima.AAC.1